MTKTEKTRKDFQRSKVYAWEQKYVAPKDQTIVPYEQIPEIVNYVWSELGLKYPPKVTPLPKQKTTCAADADRLTIRFHKGKPTYTWIILHELAHSLTCDFEGNGNQHKDDFVGIYIQLLVKFLNIPFFDLTMSARKENVKFNLKAVALETIH